MESPRVEIIATHVEGNASVALRRVGQRLDVVLGNVVLLSSAALETEETFGRLPNTLLGIAPRKVIVGGLGFGATLRGVLATCAPDAQVIVAEKLGAIIAFARGEAAHLVGGALDDPRVELVRDDVFDVFTRERDVDGIVLDVDNGPNWASFRANARLYGPGGLAKAHTSLRPGGLYAVWSGYAADGFVAQLRTAGFAAQIVPLHERGLVRARAYVGKTKALGVHGE